MKKTPGQWQKHLDELFRQKIRKLGFCEHCGRGADKIQLQTSHIIGRSNKEVRWDTENAKALCAGCHWWWHKNPIEGVEWVKDKMGSKLYNDLRVRARKTRQWSEVEYKKVEERLLREIYGSKYNV